MAADTPASSRLMLSQTVSAGRLRGSRRPAVQPPAGLRPGRLRVRGRQRQGGAARLGPDPRLRWNHHLLGEFDSTKVGCVACFSFDFAPDEQEDLIRCSSRVFLSVLTLIAHWLLRYLHRAVDPDAPPLAPQPKASSPYRTVGCVFNHRTFLANCQPSDAVNVCVFDFQVVCCFLPW